MIELYHISMSDPAIGRKEAVYYVGSLHAAKRRARASFTGAERGCVIVIRTVCETESKIVPDKVVCTTKVGSRVWKAKEV